MALLPTGSAGTEGDGTEAVEELRELTARWPGRVSAVTASDPGPELERLRPDVVGLPLDAILRLVAVEAPTVVVRGTAVPRGVPEGGAEGRMRFVGRLPTGAARLDVAVLP